MTRKIIVDEAHNAICTSAAQCMQDQRRKAKIFSKQTKRGSTAGHGLQCGLGRSSGQRLGRNGCGWQSGDAQERTARPSGRTHGGSLLACNTWQNAEHEELIDVYSTRVGWRSSRPNRLYFGFTRLVSPRHTAGPAHLHQNGPQTDHRRGGKKTERWRESKPHEKTTEPPALGGSGRLERQNGKTLVQREPRKLEHMVTQNKRNSTGMQERHEKCKEPKAPGIGETERKRTHVA